MDNSRGFDQIENLLKKYDYVAGTYLFQHEQKSSWKEKIKEKCFKCTLPLLLLNTGVMAISTMVISNFTLISTILGASALTIIVVISFIALTLKKNKPKLYDFLNWCKDLYDVNKKFHVVVQNIAKQKLELTQGRTIKIFNAFRVFVYVDLLAVTLGFAFIGSVFLPESIYPKYSLPAPLMYPFKDQRTPHAFIIGLISQIKAAMDAATLTTVSFAIFYCITSHILTYLDIIVATVRLLRNEMELKLLVNDEPEEETDRIETLDRNTLRDILESIETDDVNDEKLSFDDWIKITVEMISDVNKIISGISNLYSKVFLFAEFASFGAMFFSGMLFLVVHQKHIIAFGIFWIPVLLLSICMVHETINEKFDDIKNEFYNIPWYAMSPKERKPFLTAMTCDEIQKGFNASGFHDLNNKRFAKVLHVAYSNCIILRDLTKK